MSCHITGIFTVPVSGVWRVRFSLYSYLDSSQVHESYLYLNDGQLGETLHSTYSQNGLAASTSGREWTMEASVGDAITLRATRMDAGGDSGYYRMNFCVEFISFSM